MHSTLGAADQREQYCDGSSTAARASSGKPSSLGVVSGAIAGMVAITPAAGFVTPLVAALIGAVAGVLCYYMMLVRISWKLDESLDAWAIHGMGGLWGTLATGIFAAAAIGGFAGLLEGDTSQFLVNAVAVLAVALHFKPFEIKTLGGGKRFPEVPVYALGDKVIARDCDGAFDQVFDR